MSCSSCSSASEPTQTSLQSQIQFSVYAKQLQAQRLQGDAVNRLLDEAVQLSKEVGKGALFDSQA